jgi:hypothetical protein
MEQTENKPLVAKTLDNINIKDAKSKVSDIKVFGNGNLFELLSKASSKEQGWMKSTKAMQIESGGCVIQVTTQQKNPNGSYSIAEALTFVPNVKIMKDAEGNKYLY